MDSIVERLQSYFPGLKDGILFRWDSLLGVEGECSWPSCAQRAPFHPASAVHTLCNLLKGSHCSIVQSCREAGTPRTHRRFLGRADGSYGPIPSRRPLGMLGMPMNRTAIKVRLSEQQQHACSVVARRWTDGGCDRLTCRWSDRLLLMLWPVNGVRQRSGTLVLHNAPCSWCALAHARLHPFGLHCAGPVLRRRQHIPRAGCQCGGVLRFWMCPPCAVRPGHDPDAASH